MCAAVTRKRTDGDGDVVMDNPWLISLSDNNPSASADERKGNKISPASVLVIDSQLLVTTLQLDKCFYNKRILMTSLVTFDRNVNNNERVFFIMLRERTNYKIDLVDLIISPVPDVKARQESSNRDQATNCPG